MYIYELIIIVLEGMSLIGLGNIIDELISMGMCIMCGLRFALGVISMDDLFIIINN